jgi:hypothetical protein
MNQYYTHWEFKGEIAMLVIIEYITSNFSIGKTIYISLKEYQKYIEQRTGKQ